MTDGIGVGMGSLGGFLGGLVKGIKAKRQEDLAAQQQALLERRMETEEDYRKELLALQKKKVSASQDANALNEKKVDALILKQRADIENDRFQSEISLGNLKLRAKELALQESEIAAKMQEEKRVKGALADFNTSVLGLDFKKDYHKSMAAMRSKLAELMVDVPEARGELAKAAKLYDGLIEERATWEYTKTDAKGYQWMRNPRTGELRRGPPMKKAPLPDLYDASLKMGKTAVPSGGMLEMFAGIPEVSAHQARRRDFIREDFFRRATSAGYTKKEAEEFLTASGNSEGMPKVEEGANYIRANSPPEKVIENLKAFVRELGLSPEEIAIVAPELGIAEEVLKLRKPQESKTMKKSKEGRFYLGQ